MCLCIWAPSCVRQSQAISTKLGMGAQNLNAIAKSSSCMVQIRYFYAAILDFDLLLRNCCHSYVDSWHVGLVANGVGPTPTLHRTYFHKFNLFMFMIFGIRTLEKLGLWPAPILTLHRFRCNDTIEAKRVKVCTCLPNRYIAYIDLPRSMVPFCRLVTSE
jgi:hypothetical protein